MSSPKDSGDPLYEIRTLFYIGNYQSCITEANKVKAPSAEQKREIEHFVWRAFAAQRRFAVVLDEIRPTSSTTPETVALRNYAAYLAAFYAADQQKRAALVKTVEGRVASGQLDASNSLLLVMHALVLFHEQNYDAVLRLLHQSDALECIALVVQSLLRLDRVDLAKRELKRMQDTDEDSVLTQLTAAAVNLATGASEKLQEAYYTMQELSERHGATPLLLNGQVAALMAQGRLDEADPLVQDALERDPNCAESLVNAILVAHRLGKPSEVASRHLAQLREAHPTHPFVRDLSARETEFATLAKNFREARASA